MLYGYELVYYIRNRYRGCFRNLGVDFVLGVTPKAVRLIIPAKQNYHVSFRPSLRKSASPVDFQINPDR